MYCVLMKQESIGFDNRWIRGGKKVNQRERKKRTAKTESAVKTVEKAETVKVEQTKKAVVKAAKAEKVYNTRFEKKLDELRWLYMELYGNSSMFAELCDQMHRFYEERTDVLKKLDSKREADPDWYKKNDMLGMMFYIDNFAGNMKGVESKIDYLEKNNVNYIHLMPFLDTPKGRSDGGYAVADFRKVQENLGTMDDLEELQKEGTLFSEDIFEEAASKIKRKQSVLKAICLHVAHGCNMDCRYCFAGKGDYSGKAGIMPLEVGKQALDYLVEQSGSRKNLEVDFFG